MKRAGVTARELAQSGKVNEAEALEMLEAAARYGLVRRRGDLWFLTERALRRHFLGAERTAS